MSGLVYVSWPRAALLANISGKGVFGQLFKGPLSGVKRKYKRKVAGILRCVPEGKENNHEEEGHL